MESVAGIDRNAELRGIHGQTFGKGEGIAGDGRYHRAGESPQGGPLRDVFCELQQPGNRRRLANAARNGVETEVVYPGCCGVPQLEQGDLSAVAESAKTVSKELGTWIDKGYDVTALVPSCM